MALSTGVLRDLGRLAAAQVFPNDVEQFFITIQVLEQDSPKIVITHTMPIMPEQMHIMQQYLLNITNTFSGVFVDDFGPAPKHMTFSGTFGRKISFLSGDAAFGSFTPGAPAVRTGFGVLKHLEQLVEESHGVNPSTGQPRKTILYNWAFNQHTEITINSFSARMAVNQNNIWLYQMNMTGLRPFLISGFSFDQVLRQIVGRAATRVVRDVLAKSLGALV